MSVLYPHKIEFALNSCDFAAAVSAVSWGYGYTAALAVLRISRERCATMAASEPFVYCRVSTAVRAFHTSRLSRKQLKVIPTAYSIFIHTHVKKGEFAS